MSSAASGGVRIEPVRTRRDLKQFIELAWQIYARDPMWVPPLRGELKAVLDRNKHPYHRHAESEYFLARADSRVLGRIVITINRQHLEFHGERAAFFGFFESVAEPVVANALLGAAEAWARARGMQTVRGPMSFSTNEEFCSPGVLVSGFDQPPAIMMTYTPPYYASLLEDRGYRKAKDVLAYRLDGPEPPERLARGVARLQRAESVQIRPIRMHDFWGEVRRIKDIYNSAWEQNWGFVPMTDAEFEHMARQLKPVVDARLCLIAEVRGEPIGFALALPDYNLALRHLNGRLFPIGLLKLLWYRRQIHSARVITLGLRPGYRHKGIDAMLYLRLFTDGPRAGFYNAECSWILEDNWEMRRGLERMGARAYKMYRVYEKEL